MPAKSSELTDKELKGKLNRAAKLFANSKTRFNELMFERNIRVLSILRTFSTSLPREVKLAALFYQLPRNLHSRVPEAVARILRDADKLSVASSDSAAFLKAVSSPHLKPSAVLVNMASAMATLRNPNVPEDERKRIARIALHIHAPLAESMGIHWVGESVGNLALRHAYPEQHAEIESSLVRGEAEFRRLHPSVLEHVRQAAAEMGVHYETSHRVKQPYSAFIKLRKKFGGDEIAPDALLLEDAAAMRVVLHGEEKDCYRLFRRLQDSAEFNVKLVDDYIRRPKVNGYKSLHVLVRPRGGNRDIELQIRTQVMHASAEGDDPRQFHNLHKLSHLPKDAQAVLKSLSRKTAASLEARWKKRR